jgi:translocation and assembly module TamB
MQVRNESSNTLIADVKLTSGKNDVRLSGRYLIDKQSMDMQLNVMRMDLATVLPFAQGQVRTAGGSVHATATVQGTISKPIIRGEIGFDSAFIAPTFLGERFSLPDQTIKVTETGFALNNFTLQDSSGNKAILDGEVNTTDYQHYNYNLYLSMANFRLVNTKKQLNQMFYGQLTVDSELEIWGSLESPNVDGYVRVNRATDFAFILPGNNPELVSREGVVRFIDVDNPGDTVFLNPIDTLKARTGLQGLNLFVDVSTDTSAQLALVVDERNGDILKFRGRGDLAAGVDRSGKVSLTGTYELVGGSYEINFNFLKRRFDILRGSYVTWTGEPTTAQVNINATYTANTASIDLVEPQLVGRSPAEINRYKQRLDFIVMLSMTGEILKPVLQFDIALPETQAAQWRDVNERLEELRRDDAEMNKQVFALLLLNRFVSENPFQSAAGTSNPVSSFARQSVSRLLSEQLNNLAGNLIKGVDLNFGVMSQEDFTTGERLNRTDLTVGVSKQLMNDRLRISVGSNFELEGPQNTNASKSNIAGDVQVDYQLSRDGRYMLRAYRRNQYDFIVEGQVVETGVSFIFSLDFDSLRELFRKSNSPVIIQRRNLRTGAPIVNQQ